ncbi:MAG: hypothetical protein U0V75_10450 [Ferruginibacter sp.]
MKHFYKSFLVFLMTITATMFILSSCHHRGEEYEGEEENEEYDGPEKAAEWQFNRTKDPATGRVPSDLMWQAVLQTQQMKDAMLQSNNIVSALTWTERGSYTDAVGPSNGNTRANSGVTSGRVDAICVDAADPTGKTVLIGGDMGGLWKTTDITAFPATWTLVNDYMGNLVVSSICQDPSNLDIFYMSTGEAYYGGELGVGVFKSTDHGATWNLLPSTSSFTQTSEILCDAAGNVYLGTRGFGLQRSTNGGTTWTDITPTGLSNRIGDLKISSTGRLHVTTGIATTSAYRYTDNPSTVTAAGWTAPATPFTSFTQRIEIAVSQNTLYALPCNTAYQVATIYKSTDGGANWSATAGQPTAGWASQQGWYALAACINPADPNQCIVGGLDNFRTLDGGATWTKISAWVGTTGQYVHADQHNSIWYDNGNKLIFGCDGGVFYSSDGGTTSRDRNVGLRLKEFYSCAIHPSSTNYFLAGAQDNGTHQLNGPGLTSSVEVTGGDGAYVDIDQDQPQYQYGAYVYNQYRRSTNGGANWSSVNFSSSAGQFINPFDYDDVGNRMYCSYNAGTYLRWEDPQTGATFTPVSVTNFNGGAAMGITVSPFTANRVYFGTTSGRVVRVDNAEQATPTETNLTPAGMAGTVNSISVGSSDQFLVACVSNYGVNNVWVSSDGGTTWTQCDGNLPNIPVYWAVFHPDNNGKMIIATETGVWETESLNAGATIWAPSVNFPTVRTSMLRYRSSDRTLLASTYGRGLWTAPIPTGCTSAGVITQPVNSAACVAANASFSITATGVSYQWQESTNGGGTWNNITNGGIYGGATTTTLTLTGVTGAMNTYQYRCVVTGDCSPTPVNSNGATLTVNAATNITGQPSPSTICQGLNTSFSVAATGTTLSYQWQVSTDGGVTYNNITNGGVYSGATTVTLNITGATAAMNNYRYRCVVNSACSPLNSSAVILTVNATPAISSQPVNTAICAGNNASFAVTASGTGIGYQWQESTNGGGTWTNITNGGIYSGATTTTLTLTGAVIGMNTYQYRCVITGTCSPAATSTAAVLTVGSTLVINNQPGNSIVCAGATANYSVNVSGTVTYQWQESTNGGGTWTNITNGGIYSNATTASLTITGVTAGMNNYLYRCTVSGNCPSINSSSASLTVNTAPGITAQPVASAVICAGQNTSFTVGASGTALTYQWQLSTDGGVTYNNLANGGVYSNVTTATMNITGAIAGMNTYRYRCVVGGTCTPGATSSAAALTVNTPVSVSANPANSLVCENSNTSFSVTAAGTSPTYQWQVSTNGGVSFSNITNGGVYTGATLSTLTLSTVTAAYNSYQYRCVVTGSAPCGALNSGTATLSINNAPAAFTITGGGSYCAGGAGVPVGLSNSVAGINYQLLLNGVNTGTPLAGTGAAISFGNKTAAGTYTVIATNNSTGCTLLMPGSVTVGIYPQPVVALSASPYTRVFPGLTTTLTVTATSGTTPYNYAWFKNNLAVSNTGNTYSVNVTNMGDYRVTVTDANGCTAQSLVVNIADSANNKLFIYPSPNDGRFNVVYYNQGNTTVERTLAIYSSKGEKVYYNKFSVNQPYQVIAIDLRRNGADVYYVVLGDASGNKLKTGEVMVR